MSVSNRVWVICGALVATIVLLLLIGVVVSSRLWMIEERTRITATALHTHLENEKIYHAICGQIYKAVLAAESRDFHNVSLVQTRFLDRKARLQRGITANSKLVLPLDVQAAIQKVEAPLADYLADSSRIMQAIDRRLVPSRQQLAVFDEKFLRFENTLGATSALLEARVAKESLAEDRLTSQWNWFLTFGGLILLAVAIAMTIMLRRGVVDPIVRVTGALRRYSAGELDVAVTDTGRDDEIGQLAKGVVTFKAAVESARLAEQRSLAADEQHRRSAAHKASGAVPNSSKWLPLWKNASWPPRG